MKLILLLALGCGELPDDRLPEARPIVRLERFIDVGVVAVEESRTARIIITNDGDAPLEVRAVEVSSRLGDGWRIDALDEPLWIDREATSRKPPACWA